MCGCLSYQTLRMSLKGWCYNLCVYSSHIHANVCEHSTHFDDGTAIHTCVHVKVFRSFISHREKDFVNGRHTSVELQMCAW